MFLFYTFNYISITHVKACVRAQNLLLYCIFLEQSTHTLIKSFVSLEGMSNHSYRHAGLCLETLTSLHVSFSLSLAHVTLSSSSSLNYGWECFLHWSVSQVYSNVSGKYSCITANRSQWHDGWQIHETGWSVQLYALNTAVLGMCVFIAADKE